MSFRQGCGLGPDVVKHEQNMSSSEFQSKILVKFRRYKVGTVTYLYMFKDLGTNLDLFFPNEENQIANLYIPYIALAEAGNRNKRRQKGAGSATLTYHFRPISCLNFSGMGMGWSEAWNRRLNTERIKPSCVRASRVKILIFWLDMFMEYWYSIKSASTVNGRPQRRLWLPFVNVDRVLCSGSWRTRTNSTGGLLPLASRLNCLGRSTNTGGVEYSRIFFLQILWTTTSISDPKPDPDSEISWIRIRNPDPN